jgi:ankyrin repeat protein
MRPKTSKQTKKKQNGLPKIPENYNPETVIPVKTKKPDVRKPLTDKERVLLKACQTNDIDMVYLQYWDKVNLNCKDLVTGSTPLSTACQYGNQQIASLLIELGAKYDKVDEYGTSPLHYAANLENQKIAKTLVDKFSLSMADMNIQDDYGSTPLHFASARNNTHAVNFLVSSCITS